MNTDLLRPPAHRGPLIAAGAVVLAVGVVLEELRLGDKLPIGVHVLITAATAAVILGIGLQAPTEGGRPRAYQSVLLVTGLLLLYLALLRLADALGATFGGGGDSLVWANLPPGAITWTSLVLAGAAGWAAFSRRSARVAADRRAGDRARPAGGAGVDHRRRLPGPVPVPAAACWRSPSCSGRWSCAAASRASPSS